MGLVLASEHVLMSAVLMDVFLLNCRSLTGAKEKGSSTSPTSEDPT